MANPSSNDQANTRDHAVCFAQALAEELVEVEALRARRGINSGALTQNEILERKHLLNIAADAGKSGRDNIEGKEAAEEAKFVVGQARKLELAGLAFSGGGIRSATFNLGVLQGLAQYNKVRAFDYLSTVSGGGYIGNWLEAWIKRSAPEQDKKHPAGPHIREGIDAVEEQLRPTRTARPRSVEMQEWADQKSHTEPPPIRFLRDFSNYLTPRLGAFGADTWTVIAIYLRNLFLNQSVLILFSFTLLLLPYIAVWLTHAVPLFFTGPWLTNLWPMSSVCPWLAPTAVFLLLTGALSIGAGNLKGLIDCAQPNYCIQQPREGPVPGKKYPWLLPYDQRWVLLTIVAPVFLALWILVAWLWPHAGNWDAPQNTYWWPLGGMVLLGLPLCIVSAITVSLQWEGVPYVKMLSWFFASLAAGAVAGFLMLAASRQAFTPMRSWPGADWHMLSLAFPLTVLIFLAACTLKVGLMGRSFYDPYREWWARVAGWILILAIFWMAGFSVAIYAPLGLLWLRGWVKAAGLAAWAGSTLAGVLGGKNAKTVGDDPQSMTSRLLSFTPYVFIVGLLSLLSLSLELILARLYLARDGMQAAWNSFLAESPTVEKVAGWVLKVNGNIASGTLTVNGTATAPASPSTGSPAYVHAHFTLLHQATNGWLILACLLVFGVCVWLSYRVDLNEFSMNLMYRNRLVRCYLGATHERRSENPFSGLDCRDDLFLSSLRSSQCYSGPLPILNSTLNLVNSRELAWQERKAESFPMTPFRCGFDTWIEQANLERDYLREKDEAHISKYAYRMTEQYAYKDGGFFVGTAMSISGAAASPNMGYHTSPSLAILMTFFNVRLGFWAGNPRNNDTWFLPGPTVGLNQLISELLGLTNDNAKYVYLSDGGHFENLGIYELVKRRCKFIIACDAGADPNYSFDDLGNAIRKCRQDIGVEIEIGTSPLVPKSSGASEGKNNSDAKKLTSQHFVFGTIHYDMADPEGAKGILLYIKASLTGEEPSDVLNYQTANPTFPHQSTTDQWFSESQFESYRRLGQHIVDALFEGPKDSPHYEDLKSDRKLQHYREMPVGRLFDELKKKWPDTGAKPKAKTQKAH